ncbi:MAG: nickel pincer cofactor biosynthesis protein LarC [Pseudomonadota bacterium]
MSDRLLHLDPYGGASGDMVLGALCDLGVPVGVIEKSLAAVGLDGVRVSLRREQRHGVSGQRAVFVDEQGRPIDPLEADQATVNHHHGHTHAGELLRRIARSALPDEVRDLSLRIFRRLAEAEARVHGVSVDEVALHEVGGQDAIADVVGAATALHHLQPARVSVGPLPLGGGSVHAAHGVLPAPAPATLQLLLGAPVQGIAVAHECVTPTGAAILTTLAQRYGAIPNGTLRAVGTGLGRRDPQERANLLRALLLDAHTTPALDDAGMVEIQTNLDDETGEVLAHTIQRLLAQGCVDAWAVPGTMKKGRPATILHALAPEAAREAVIRLLLEETSSLGLRWHRVERATLQRRVVEAHTRFGVVRVKLGLDGERVLKTKPEFDDCQRLATQAGVPLRQVIEAALRAADGEVVP